MSNLVKYNKKFGLSMVAEAKRLNEEIKKKKVLSEVQIMLTVIEDLKKQVAASQKCLEHNQARLKAIEEGAFNFDMETLIITFHDSKLNVVWHHI